MLVKSKLNSIETLTSEKKALIDMEICHKEFVTILKEKDKYERMKDALCFSCVCIKWKYVYVCIKLAKKDTKNEKLK